MERTERGWKFDQAGAVEGLVQLLAAPAAQPRALADAVFALKRLTAADRRSRAAFVDAAGPDALLRLLDCQQHQLMAPLPCYPAGQALALPATRAAPGGSRPGSAGLPPRSPMGLPPRSPLGAASTPDSRRGGHAASEAGSALSQACTPERSGTSQRWTPGCARPAGADGTGSGVGAGEYGAQMQYSAARILRHLALDGDAGHKVAARGCLPALVQALQVACNGGSSFRTKTLTNDPAHAAVLGHGIPMSSTWCSSACPAVYRASPPLSIERWSFLCRAPSHAWRSRWRRRYLRR